MNSRGRRSAHCLVELRLECRGGGSRKDGVGGGVVWSTESHSQKRGPGVGLGGVTPKEAGGRHRQAGLDVLGVIPAAYLATN